MVGFAAGQLFVGPMSDRFGRKPVLVISLSLFVVASGLCAIAPDLETLSGARLLQALGASASMSVGRAIVRDTFFIQPDRAGLRLCRHGLGNWPHHRPDIRRSDRGKRWVAGNIRVRRRLWRADADLHPCPAAGNEPPVDAERDQSEKTDRELCDTALQPRIHGLRDVQHNLLRGIFAFTSCSAYVLIRLLKVSRICSVLCMRSRSGDTG